MPTCHNCGGFVSSEFARVFGDNEDEVDGCVQCLNFSDLNTGASTDPS